MLDYLNLILLDDFLEGVGVEAIDEYTVGQFVMVTNFEEDLNVFVS